MRILLINPPFHRFMGLEQDYVPLSLLAVGSKLSSDGHEVFVKNLEVGPQKEMHYCGYDSRLTQYENYQVAFNNLEHLVWKEYIEVLSSIKPDKIGFTIMNAKYRSAEKLIGIAKEEKIPVMVGGIHPTLNPGLYNECEVIQGEFEENPNRVKDLDSLPFPNYGIFLDKYSPDGYSHMMTSRGCPFKCRFCGSSVLWHRKVTWKSVDRILSEMKHIKELSNCSSFTFWDETFTMKHSRVKEFCKKYSIDAKWRCDTRADMLNYELVEMMKASGCSQMSIGIESGVNEILEYIGKGETIEQFQRAAEILNKLEMEWKAYCIVGFPEETIDDILKTVQFVKSLNPSRITMSIFTPYVGTSLFDECKDLYQSYSDPTFLSHQSPYNHFARKIRKDEFQQLVHQISQEIDQYNSETLKHWK